MLPRCFKTTMSATSTANASSGQRSPRIGRPRRSETATYTNGKATAPSMEERLTIRVTPKLTRWVIGALIGALVLSLANVIAYFFLDDGLGLRSGGTIAIVFSLVMIGIAAFMLLLDFDMADEAIRRGAPAKFAWYIAFGLLVTVVWLYIEILRLLSYFRD